jgi:four helix bundle protein
MSSSNPLPYAKSFTDLVVYQKTRSLSREIFILTKRFPREEAYSLTDQWRRAVRSVGAQIAEAWAKRRYPKSFASKLSDADGEQTETQHWTLTAFDDGYISKEEAAHLGSACKEIGAMLGEMIDSAESFCGDDYRARVREDGDEPESWFSFAATDQPTASPAAPLNTEY